MKLSRLLFAVLTAGLGVASVPGTASADVYLLTSDHCTGGCLGGAANAGSVTVTSPSAGTLIFNVSLGGVWRFVSTGFQTDFGFNLAGNPTITFSNVASGFAPNANPETAGALHMDGTGDFEYGVNCTACGSGGSNPQTGPLTFTITGAGLTLASLEANALGQFFAVDLINLSTGRTGAVDASQVCTPPVCNPQIAPEPATLALIGVALLGMGVPIFRRRNRIA